MADEKVETMILARPEFLSPVKLNYIAILAIIASDYSKFGLTEEEIKAKSINKEDVMEYIAQMEHEGRIVSGLYQKNTASPYIRHYKLKDKIEITVTIRKL